MILQMADRRASCRERPGVRPLVDRLLKGLDCGLKVQVADGGSVPNVSILD